jgi:histidyl-tRNA synthetase
MSTDEFATALDEATGAKEISRALVRFLTIKEISDLPVSLQSSESARSIAAVIDTARAQGIRNIEFDVTLMRGFDYYTDIVFEAFATDGENNRSVLGGGRYDGLVGLFGVEPVPTIGFAVGDVVFRDYLETNKLIPTMRLPVELTILIRDEQSANGAQTAARELREIGVNVAVDFSGRKIDKQFKNAVKSGVRYVLFVGQEELESEQYILKDIKNSSEEKHSLARIVSIVKDQRK